MIRGEMYPLYSDLFIYLFLLLIPEFVKCSKPTYELQVKTNNMNIFWLLFDPDAHKLPAADAYCRFIVSQTLFCPFYLHSL